MKNVVKFMAFLSLFLMPMPGVLADEMEYRAILTPQNEVEVVDTIPAQLPTGVVVLKKGATVIGGERLVLPSGGYVTMPTTLRKGMSIKVKMKD